MQPLQCPCLTSMFGKNHFARQSTNKQTYSMMLTPFLCCSCCLFCLQFVGPQGSNCILNLLGIFTAEALNGQLQQQLQEGLVVLVGDMRQEEAAGRITDARGAWPVKPGKLYMSSCSSECKVLCKRSTSKVTAAKISCGQDRRHQMSSRLKDMLTWRLRCSSVRAVCKDRSPPQTQGQGGGEVVSLILPGWKGVGQTSSLRPTRGYNVQQRTHRGEYQWSSVSRNHREIGYPGPE